MMKYQYVPYCWPLWISACITLSLGAFTFVKRRSAKGALSFTISMLIVTVWSAGNALEILGADFTTKLFWANIQYFAYCYSPVSLLAVCMEYLELDKWIRNKKFFLLCIIPTIVFCLVWTDRSFGIVRSNMHLVYAGTFASVAKTYGPVFYIHTIYSYLLNTFAWGMLFNASFFKHSIYRKQAFSLLLGLTMIMFANFSYIANFFPKYHYDITPVVFAPAGIIAAWGLFRYRLFEIVPMAWATVLRIMGPGLMIMDTQGQVLDVNPSFEKIFGIKASKAITKPFWNICSKFPEFSKLRGGSTHCEFSVQDTDFKKTYEAFLSPLFSDTGTFIGKFLIVYDATEKRAAQDLLMQQQWQLAVNKEREKMAMDLHDNLGQVLGFINLQAQGIRQELQNSGIDLVTGRLNRLVEASQSAHTELREYIRSIRVPAYSETDLLTALQQNISDFENQTGVRVKLNIPDGFGAEKIEPEIRIQILSVIKEALNNVQKHARAKNVSITFLMSPQLLRVDVRDDGNGFITGHITGTNGSNFGLGIMRERACGIGGKLKIKSAPGKGCTITLSIPINLEGDKHETNAG